MMLLRNMSRMSSFCDPWQTHTQWVKDMVHLQLFLHVYSLLYESYPFFCLMCNYLFKSNQCSLFQIWMQCACMRVWVGVRVWIVTLTWYKSFHLSTDISTNWFWKQDTRKRQTSIIIASPVATRTRFRTSHWTPGLIYEWFESRYTLFSLSPIVNYVKYVSFWTIFSYYA